MFSLSSLRFRSVRWVRFFKNILCGRMSCDGGMSSLRLACLLYVFVVFSGSAFFKNIFCVGMSSDGGVSSLRVPCLLYVCVVCGGCAFFNNIL
jgi:hypothetical protein